MKCCSLFETLKVLFVFCGQLYYRVRNVWNVYTFIEYMIRLYAADYTRQLKLCTKLHNTDLDICDLWHAKSIYFRSTDTLRIQWPFPLHKVGVAFLIYESNQDGPCDFVIWAADNRCVRARESVCPWSCSKPYTLNRIWRSQNLLYEKITLFSENTQKITEKCMAFHQFHFLFLL